MLGVCRAYIQARGKGIHRLFWLHSNQFQKASIVTNPDIFFNPIYHINDIFQH